MYWKDNHIINWSKSQIKPWSAIRWVFALFFSGFALPGYSQVEGSLWDVKYIHELPAYTARQKGVVKEMIYTALEYRGLPKKVFAYYSTPGMIKGDVSLDINLPAVILVHGGTGTAYSEWVKMWAEKGYAAFAMDLRGRDPSGAKIPGGYDETTSDMPVYKLYQPLDEQFLFQAVGDVITAHNLLRSFKEVDSTKTAICGISWGAVISLIASGVDQRFKAVVPIYGSGFFPTSNLQALQGLDDLEKQVWVDQYDPKQYVKNAKMPVLFVNGTNDNNFYLDSYAKTYNLVGKRNLSIQNGLKHSHEDGFVIPEPYAFVNSYTKGGKKLALLKKPQKRFGITVSGVRSEVGVSKGVLNFTTDSTHPLMNRKWQMGEVQIKNNRLRFKKLPQGTTMWFFSVIDERGMKTSGDIQFLESKYKL